jgi:prevent-host-death family protein
VSVVELRSNLAELLNRVQYGGERVTVTRNGKPAAVIISQADLEYLEALEDYFDVRKAKESLADGETLGTISWEAYLMEAE